MGRQSGLRPIVQRAPGCSRNELLRAFANQANNLRARIVIEPPGRQNLRDLFAKLKIALQRLLDVLPDRRGHAAFQSRAIRLSHGGIG